MESIEFYIKKYNLEKVIPKNLRDYVYIKNYGRGEYILDSEEKVNNIYFILKGKIEISHIQANGKKIFITFLNPLEIFGDVEYINSGEALYDVVANTSTTILVLPFSIIDKHLYNNPDFLRFICQEGNKKLLATNRVIMLRKTLPLKPFFCNFIINKGYSLEFKKLDDLASELNVSYRNLTRVIKELLDDGIIEKDRYSIKVIDKEAIEEYSELF